MAERSLNKVMLLGRVGKDPEIRYTASGKAVATFSLATSEKWRDQDGNDKERTEWHRLVAWGRLGEICGEYLSKGKQVYVEGRIQTREWEDQDGNRRTTVEIIVSDMIMLGGGGGSSQGRDYEESHRNRGAAPARTSRDAGKKAAEDRPSYTPPPEDDIPF